MSVVTKYKIIKNKLIAVVGSDIILAFPPIFHEESSDDYIMENIFALSQEVYEQLENVKMKSKIYKDDYLQQKMILQQNIASLNNLNIASSIQEVTSQVRTLISENTQNFETEYSDMVFRNTKPEIGALWKRMRDLANQIGENDLEENRRSTEIQLTIFEDSLQKILKDMRMNFESVCAFDIHYLNSSIDNCKIELEQYVSENLSLKLNLGRTKLSCNSKIEEIVASALRIETPYQGSYPKMDFRSMIIEMRSYSIMFILLVSTFGLNKIDNPVLTNGIYLVSLTLVVIGIFATYAKMQDLKIDKKTDELKRARDRISIELRRCITEFMSDWKNYVNINYRHAINKISVEIDKTIKENLQLRQDANMRDKGLISQQILDLEALDRINNDRLKQLDILGSEILILRQSIEKLLLQ